jgi:hypothetical protein
MDSVAPLRLPRGADLRDALQAALAGRAALVVRRTPTR